MPGRRMVVLLLFLFAGPAAAQDEGREKKADREVVVTATRSETLAEDVPDVLQVVRRDDIEKLHPRSLGDVLEYLPGVSVETGTGSGLPTRSIVSLNGLPANYTLVLVNGVRLLSDHIHSGQNVEMIPAESIERIEIIRGAASVQYGTDAIGGVVNIITRKAGKEPQNSVKASAGTYHTYGADATLLQPAGENVGVSLSLHRSQSDGVPLIAPTSRDNNMGYERHIGMARVDVAPDESTDLFAWFHGVDNTSDWRGADADSYLATTAVGGSRRLDPQVEVFAQFSYSKWDAEVNGEENEWLQPESHLRWEIDDAHAVVGGAEYRRNMFSRSAATDLPGQDAFGAFLQHEWNADETLVVMTAVRLDTVEEIETAVSPKISAVYSPEGLPVHLRACVGRGFHAPTLQELYEEAYGHGGAARRFGNPDLDPEYSTTYAFGADASPVEGLTLSAYTQYSDIDDMIVPVYEGPWALDPAVDVWRRQNIEDAWVFSVEFTAAYVVCPRLRVEGGFTVTDNEDKDTGRQLPYDPGHSIFAKAFTDWDFGSGWSCSGFVGLRAVFDRSAWNWKPPASAPPGDPSGMTTDLEDYEKLDAGITVTHAPSRLSISVNACNLLGEDIENLDDVYTILDGEPVWQVEVKWVF